VVSPEFVWVAFLLWLLAGHLFTRWQPIVFAAVVYGVVAAAPVVHHGATTWAGIIGPLVGGVFALGLSRGCLPLEQDAGERERLLASLTRARRATAARPRSAAPRGDEPPRETRRRVDPPLLSVPDAAVVARWRTAQSALATARVHAAGDRVVVSLIDAEEAVRLDNIDNCARFDMWA